MLFSTIYFFASRFRTLHLNENLPLKGPTFLQSLWQFANINEIFIRFSNLQSVMIPIAGKSANKGISFFVFATALLLVGVFSTDERYFHLVPTHLTIILTLSLEMNIKFSSKPLYQ